MLGDECEILLYRDGEGVPEWAEGKKFLGKGESIPDDTDALLLSPSVPLNRPLVKACKEKNIPVMGELELGYIRSKCRVVAVTGTNGKTTTVSLINHILRSAGRSSYALGNIGVPFCSMCIALTFVVRPFSKKLIPPRSFIFLPLYFYAGFRHGLSHSYSLMTSVKKSKY